MISPIKPSYDYLIVGAGFFGAICAHELTKKDYKVLVIEKRDHIGGNCYTKNEKCPNCHTATRKEKLTGATFQLKVFSEHEECRVCLEPGLSRRCCNNYYCDSCYYKLPTCRSCGSQVGHVGDENKNKFLYTKTFCSLS